MKKSNISICQLALIPICCLVVILSFVSRKSFKTNTFLQMRVNQIENTRKEYNSRFAAKLFTDQIRIDDSYLIGIDGDSLLLRSLLSNPKLIFKFSNDFCGACVDDAVEKIKTLGENIGYDKIIIITNNSSTRLLKIFITSHDIKSPCYNSTGNLNLRIEEASTKEKIPFFLIVDETFKVQFSFYGDENSELMNLFFLRIKEILSSVQYVPRY